MDAMRTSQRQDPAGPPAEQVRGRSGGIGRATSDAAERVSDDLRRREGAFLGQRRRIARLSLVASAAMGVVSAYQTGVVKHLPEPPVPGLDADRVDASGEAYQFLKTPDAALGLASYGATLVLAGMGGADRATKTPWIPLALAGKVLFDALGGIYLTLEQGTKHRRFCGWCLVASGASVAMVPVAVPEARAAVRRLLGR